MKTKLNFSSTILLQKMSSVFFVSACALTASNVVGFIVLHRVTGYLPLATVVSTLLAVLTRKINPQGKYLLSVWIYDLGQKLEHFPITSAENSRITDWALNRLRQEAIEATTAFKLRDASNENLTRILAQPLGGPQLIPEKMGELRALARARKKTISRQRKATGDLSEIADRQHKKYLRIWDFFTRDNPNGLAILADLGSPETFRRNLLPGAERSN